MKRTYSARALYTLLLMVSFQIFGGGNFAQAQTEQVENATVSLNFEGTGTFPYNENWIVNNFIAYGSLSHDDGTQSASSAGKESGYVQYKNKLTGIKEILFYISKTSKNTNTNSYYKVETSEDGTTWTEKGRSVTFDQVTQNQWTETKITLTTPIDGYVRISYTGTTATRLLDDITITYTSGEESQVPNIKFESDNYSPITLENGTASTTIKATIINGVGTITYSIKDNTPGATISEEGIFTATQAGTYYIVATAIVEGTTLTKETAIEVKDAVVTTPITTFYKKITSTDELVDGAQYIFVCESQNVAMESIENNKGNVINITPADGILAENPSFLVFTLEKEEDNNIYYFKDSNGKYLNNTNSTSNINLIDKYSTATGIQWTVAMDGTDFKMNSAANSSNYLCVNTATNPVIFRTYKSTNYNNYGHIQLYRKVGEINADEAVDNYATFYVDYAYEMPEGVTGYAVEVEIGGKLTMNEAYKAGEAVPAKTPLLLHGENAGTFNPAVLNKKVKAYDGYNELLGERDYDGYTTCTFVDPLFYKLAVNGEGKAGFFWGAENGAPFKMQKHTTAFLAAPKNRVSNVRGFVFNPGEATGIDSVATETEENAPVYTLSGIRVRTAKSELPAGIYIMNGKKLMVK